MQIIPTEECHLTPVRMAFLSKKKKKKKRKIASVGEDVKKRKILYIVYKSVN
jgi:hypothetical protein